MNHTLLTIIVFLAVYYPLAYWLFFSKKKEHTEGEKKEVPVALKPAKIAADSFMTRKRVDIATLKTDNIGPSDSEIQALYDRFGKKPKEVPVPTIVPLQEELPYEEQSILLDDIASESPYFNLDEESSLLDLPMDHDLDHDHISEPILEAQDLGISNGDFSDNSDVSSGAFQPEVQAADPILPQRSKLKAKGLNLDKIKALSGLDQAPIEQRESPKKPLVKKPVVESRLKRINEGKSPDITE